MKNRKMLFAIVGLILVVSFSCGSDDSDKDMVPDDSNTDLPEVFSKFSDDLNIYLDGDFVVIETDDIPDHNSPYFGVGHQNYESYNGSNPAFHLNPNTIQEQSFVIRIPLNPGEASSKQNTQLGAIGVAVNGVVIFNQYAGPDQPLTNEINSFDQYNGHPQQTGEYHYHLEPSYLTGNNGPSSLIGFLLDGFPVYGPEEDNEVVTNADLDAYHGHSHATADFLNGIYHYHITSEDPYINGGQFYGEPGTVTN